MGTYTGVGSRLVAAVFKIKCLPETSVTISDSRPEHIRKAISAKKS